MIFKIYNWFMNRKREQDQTEQIKCDVMNDERIMYRIHHRHNKDFTCQYCATVYETYGEKETDYRKKRNHTMYKMWRRYKSC